MKIILCIFLLNITAVSVFGQSVELNGILGQSVKFPAAVEKGGYLMYSGDPIGDVTSGIFRASLSGNYRDRVQWDSSTGLFSLSGLKMEDIGEYKVQNTDQNIITVFQLNVHIPVSKPHVSITQNEYPCTIECTAESGTGVTLSWYREGEKKSYVSSRVESAPHLHLPAPVERSGTYTCEAKNSVSNEKASITVGAHCTVTAFTDYNPFMWILIAVVVLLFLAIVAYCLWRRFCLKKIPDIVDPHEYGDAVQAVPQSGNRSKHSTNDDIIRRYQDIIRRYQAVRPLIQVKKILDNVDPHAYGNRSKQPTKDAVAALNHVKKLLVNLTPHTYAVRTLIQVHDFLVYVDQYKYDETIPPDDETIPPDDETIPPDDETIPLDAVAALNHVIKLLDPLDPYEFLIQLLDDVDPDEYIIELLDDVDPDEYN